MCKINKRDLCSGKDISTNVNNAFYSFKFYSYCMDILIFLITVQEGFDNYRGDEIAPGAEVQTDEQIDQFIRCQNLKKIRLLL